MGSPGAHRAGWALLFLTVATVSWFGREGHSQEWHRAGRDGWVTLDPDTWYHLRRVDRAITDGMPPAGTDPHLSYPDGSPIPWPPYYTWVAWAATAPFAPDDDAEARRAFVEQRVSSLPQGFSVATSLVVAMAGATLAGAPGALLAGGGHALSHASMVYGSPGNGDHHAWVSLLAVAILALAASAWKGGALEDGRRGALWGAAVGVVIGVAVGSWVGSVLHVLPLQMALGWLVVRGGFRVLPGLAAFGVATHGVALLVLLPAILSSPWNEAQPWSVVNLSWFHGAWLAIGGLVFIPLLVLPAGRARRFYPALVLVTLAGIGAYLATATGGPATGVREGFEWLGREDAFMGSVWESRGVGLAEAGLLHGWGYYLLPLAWVGAAWFALGRDRFALLPWVFGVPLLAIEAARQYRFNETLAGPLAVLLAWGVVSAVESVRARGLGIHGGLRRGLAVAAILIALPAAHGFSVREAWTGLRRPPGDAADQLSRTVRSLCEWTYENTPTPADYSVLAGWNWGHAIEWVADRPSVGTNFGVYVGEDSFLDAARFFLAEDPAEAEEILHRRRARYVLVTSWLPKFLEQMTRGLAPEDLARYGDRAADGSLSLRPEWFGTMGARLLFDGSVVSPQGAGPPIDFARVVTVSPGQYPQAMMGEIRPAGFVWEHVQGAIVESTGEPGERLQLQIDVRYERGNYDLVWGGEAVVNADGLARVRVPYATDAPNGDGECALPARWRIGDRAGTLAIPEAAVQGGHSLRLPVAGIESRRGDRIK